MPAMIAARIVGDHWAPRLPANAALVRAQRRRKGPFAECYSNLAAGWVPRPDRIVAEIVAEKSARQFRPADELWLAIQCSTRISEMMLDIGGVEDSRTYRASIRTHFFASLPALPYRHL